MSELTVLRVIDREQTKVVSGFGSTTRANARLLALVLAGFLRRIAVGTVSGGHKYVYALTRQGALAVGTPFRPIPLKTTAVIAGQPFLEHQLRLNAVYLNVKFHPIPLPGVGISLWRTFTQPIDRQVPLIPDAYLELTTPGGIKPMFLEIDQGTESLKVWQRKTALYLQLATSGIFQRLFQRPQFRVLVIVPSVRRLQTLRRCIAAKTTKVFWLTTHEHAAGSDFWKPCWHRPAIDSLTTLL